MGGLGNMSATSCYLCLRSADSACSFLQAAHHFGGEAGEGRGAAEEPFYGRAAGRDDEWHCNTDADTDTDTDTDTSTSISSWDRNDTDSLVGRTFDD